MASDGPWLVVGLGNPGTGYARHRHNVGFMAIDTWCQSPGAGGASWREKFHGALASISGPWGRVIALKPQTYMNRSGASVARAAAFYGVDPAHIVVVHDEIDFAYGRMAVKQGGGHGGHNGLRDIIAELGSADFVRIRVGVDRPPPGGQDVAAWVLSDFGPDDLADLPDLLDRAQEAVTLVLVDGVRVAMDRVNQRPTA